MSCEPRPRTWYRAWAIVLGLGSLVWLLLRTIRKPSRLTYPCQQAALGHVSLLLGIPLVHLFRRLLARRSGVGLATAGLVGVLIATVALVGLSDTPPVLSSPLSPPADYVATIHVVEDAGGPSGTHHLGLDDLISWMGEGGLAFYRSPTAGPESGPDGVVGSEDVVLIKINSQWDQRGGTNTDVLKGLIARILEHPDGFTGEVVVVENTQSMGTLDWPQANAEAHDQSALDVVDLFADGGDPVSAYLWDDIRATAANEYDQGDLDDGYVVGPYEPDAQMSVSYPKFQTAGGAYVSLKKGIWDPGAGAYDESGLTFINVPVLKCHGAVYGVTACVKHHVGTMTTGLLTGTHGGVRYGGLGKFLAQVRMPDLNILDCIYILARPNLGPASSYTNATRADKLVAGLDPVAIDLWATANILVPAIEANGYTQYPKQDPYDPASIFRTYLDRSTDFLLEAGVTVTNDLAQIDARVRTVGVPEVGPSSSPEARAFPNPFASGTTFRFAMPGERAVRVEIYDVAGRLVRSIDALPSPSSTREVLWDGRNDAGSTVPAGTYYFLARGERARAAGLVTRVQ